MPNIFSHNYHSHTTRCGHAEGKDEDYVLAAIDNGFQTIGFTDHVFLPDIFQPRMRGSVALLDEYKSSVLHLKKKYQGKINVKLGFECEYLGEPFDTYYHKLKEQGFELLILGQHCYYDAAHRNMAWYGDLPNRQERIYRYCDDLIKGMESGLFSYVAHPDFFVLIYWDWDEHCEEVARRICQTAERLHIPLELNMGRTRGRSYYFKPDFFNYPYPRFWEIVSEYDIDVVVGVDAHSPEDYYTSDYDVFAEILRNHKLKYLPKLPL